jgi:hypothetical protein
MALVDKSFAMSHVGGGNQGCGPAVEKRPAASSALDELQKEIEVLKRTVEVLGTRLKVVLCPMTASCNPCKDAQRPPRSPLTEVLTGVGEDVHMVRVTVESLMEMLEV